VAFPVIVGEDIPDFRTISDFRKENLVHMQLLYVQTLQLCTEVGLVKLGYMALDGGKVKANALRHKATNYNWMKEEVGSLSEKVTDLPAQDDEQFGNRHGDKLPNELTRRESRLKKRQVKHWKKRFISSQRTTWRRCKRCSPSGTDGLSTAGVKTTNQERSGDLSQRKREVE
jgi:hypothetical protein